MKNVHTWARFAILLAAVLLTAGCITTFTGNDETNEPLQDPEPTHDDSADESNGHDEDGSNDEQDDSNDADRDADDDQDGEDERRSQDHPPWPSPSEANIRPGVQVSTGSGSCTSNFLFTTPGNGSLLLGSAAHCFAENPSGASDGCDPSAEPHQPGTSVNIEGASEPGVLLYSSWHSMQQGNETSQEACLYNDFALILIPQEDRATTSPAMHGYGGPTGLAQSASVSTGDKLLWYGNSNLRPGMEEAQTNEGYVVHAGPWDAVMYSATPGVPGDSGSGVLSSNGDAVGVMNTVRILPETGSNGVMLLEPALEYAAGLDVVVELATWEQLDDGVLP